MEKSMFFKNTWKQMESQWSRNKEGLATAAAGSDNKNNSILSNVMSQDINFKSNTFTKENVFFIISKYPCRVLMQEKVYHKKTKQQNKKSKQTQKRRTQTYIFGNKTSLLIPFEPKVWKKVDYLPGCVVQIYQGMQKTVGWHLQHLELLG